MVSVIWGKKKVCEFIEGHFTERIYLDQISSFIGLAPGVYRDIFLARTVESMENKKLARLCGICLYYFLENIAFTLTMASNVGVLLHIDTKDRQFWLSRYPHHTPDILAVKRLGAVKTSV